MVYFETPAASFAAMKELLKSLVLSKELLTILPDGDFLPIYLLRLGMWLSLAARWLDPVFIFEVDAVLACYYWSRLAISLARILD